ncbi:MAG: calycin-like domain-containing protein [Muribaculaceae bacterium]|nr:calycin-like domain-containing protein [Muribaculaceae bacterium]
MHKYLKTTISLFSLIILSINLVSCDKKSKSSEPSQPAAVEVAGEYCDRLTSVVMNQNFYFEDVNISVIAVDDATVNIEIESFDNTAMGMLMPDLKIENVNVTGSDGKYILKETNYSGTADTGKQYAGTLRGSSTGHKLTLEFSLRYGAMPIPMTCTYTATKS